MCQVNVDELIEHFSIEIRAALEQALRGTRAPDAIELDITRFFATFKSAMRRQCDQWESVPDELVRT